MENIKNEIKAIIDIIDNKYVLMQILRTIKNILG